MRRSLIGGGLLAALGAVVLTGSLLVGGTSPRGWIARTYPNTGVGAYRASAPPTAVAAQISRRFRPADRAYDPAGIFLRYSDSVVAVLATGAGSRIVVDDANRGYRRWYPYVGGRWGGPGGRGALFRGGGPGAGK
ncbi:MAG: DUF4247 domain-containing protein [Actinomadura sp.]